ncbi:MAG TPA: cytochrome c family protein [Rhizomicrobium sp.]|nr:cytochrome c family protein [Rhizomicrobium sp.]
MDSWEWNKIAGAVLGTLIFVMVIRIASESLFEVEPPAKPGYVVEGVEETTTASSAAPAEEALPDWGTVLASADVSKGHDISHKCEQCHDLSKGGPNKIGPNLYGVVDRPRASHPGFDYSSAMKAKGGNWTYDELFKFLKSPQAYIEGTKMSFAGLRSADDRINLIAYLRTDADSPAAIPPAKPKAAEPAPGSAPAGAAAAPAGTQPAATSTPPAKAPPAATPQGGPPKKS